MVHALPRPQLNQRQTILEANRYLIADGGDQLPTDSIYTGASYRKRFSGQSECMFGHWSGILLRLRPRPADAFGRHCSISQANHR